ncbi:hypothetical protein [Ferviditalea candida]|uniref:Glycerophosphoryl diester phosphodiesterase membrane domain-containing protein n=1 Tax=Ferviditalea candida TaxID=3108399 RepID=A0ABU5ZQA3_9BACL|nr:hypothetical protein [Paenibacillaceae bacterium T2]
MREWPLKPLGVGRLLDLSFQVYRNHFGKLFLLMLIFLVPYYILENVLTYGARDVSFFPAWDGSFSWEQFLEEGFNLPGGMPDASSAWTVFGSVVLLWIYINILTPLCEASVLYTVQDVVQGNEPVWKDMVVKPFKKFWSLLGNTVVYSLFLVAGWFVIVAATIPVIFIIAFLANTGLPPVFTHPVVITVLVVILLAAGIALLVGVAYFLVRFGFYLPPVVLENKRLGLSRSWKLTEGSFWRLFAVFFILLVVFSVFSTVTGVLNLFGRSVLTDLLEILVYLAVSPMLIVAYAVAYFDLKARSEGLDLQRMLPLAEAEVERYG